MLKIKKPIFVSNCFIEYICLDNTKLWHDEFVILISSDADKYEGLNIVSLNNNEEVLENIELTTEGMESFGGELLKDNVYLLTYKADEYKEIGIELVKKSE